ncbi:hypothetical protein [Brevundimonas denitrificans]|uniref:hypothetical protein n=1 Tax=Brevundimonas denitrificans TaxID=1443434 RepID=UPI00223C26DD|nr:hypothetical protein [Brevundimonas denitrificans]
MRGAGPANTFEVKFTDASVDNVHWRQVTRWEAPDDWTLVTIRRRHIVKAWGPNPDPVYRGSERIEFVIAAGEGGVGFIEVDQLTLLELPPEPSSPPRPTPPPPPKPACSPPDRRWTATPRPRGAARRSGPRA